MAIDSFDKLEEQDRDGEEEEEEEAIVDPREEMEGGLDFKRDGDTTTKLAGGLAWVFVVLEEWKTTRKPFWMTSISDS